MAADHLNLASCPSRKAFDRHFQESRHAFGMRALGLPNTKHFHEITKIQDALARESCVPYMVSQTDTVACYQSQSG